MSRSKRLLVLVVVGAAAIAGLATLISLMPPAVFYAPRTSNGGGGGGEDLSAKINREMHERMDRDTRDRIAAFALAEQAKQDASDQKWRDAFERAANRR